MRSLHDLGVEQQQVEIIWKYPIKEGAAERAALPALDTESSIPWGSRTKEPGKQITSILGFLHVYLECLTAWNSHPSNRPVHLQRLWGRKRTSSCRIKQGTFKKTHQTWVKAAVDIREVPKLLPGLAKLFGLTGSILVPPTSEPGFNLSLGFATLGHQTGNFTLWVIMRGRPPWTGSSWSCLENAAAIHR